MIKFQPVETKMTLDTNSSGLPPEAPEYRLINYPVTNKALANHIREALGDVVTRIARVFVGKSSEREGWAIHALIVRGVPKTVPGTLVNSEIKLVMVQSATNDTQLVTQRGRVMTWMRLEVLLKQVDSWLGGDDRSIELVFNMTKNRGIDE
jgi:hypothetical protein